MDHQQIFYCPHSTIPFLRERPSKIGNFTRFSFLNSRLVLAGYGSELFCRRPGVPAFGSHAPVPADIETLQLSHFSGTDQIGAGASLLLLSWLRTSEAPIIPETLGLWRPETPGTHTFIIITKPPSQLNTIYGDVVTDKLSS